MLRSWRWYRGLWVGTVFILVGTICAFAGIAFSIQSISLWAGTTATEGTVTASEARHSPGVAQGPQHARSEPTTNYAPVVRYEVNGQVYFTTSIVANSGEPNPVGQKIPVLYKTAQPEMGFVNTFSERWLFPMGCTTLGTIFAAIGVFILYMTKALFGRKSRHNRRDV